MIIAFKWKLILDKLIGRIKNNKFSLQLKFGGVAGTSTQEAPAGAGMLFPLLVTPVASATARGPRLAPGSLEGLEWS